jgi:hypothetical protein
MIKNERESDTHECNEIGHEEYSAERLEYSIHALLHGGHMVTCNMRGSALR